MLEIKAITYNNLLPVVPIVGRVPKEGGTMGRGPDNAITLPDPANVISRVHLQFSLAEGGLHQAHNISNSNPAFIDDQELLSGRGCLIKDGSKIVIGGYVLQAHYTNDGEDDPVSGTSAIRGVLSATNIPAAPVYPAAAARNTPQAEAGARFDAAFDAAGWPEPGAAEIESSKGSSSDPFAYASKAAPSDPMQILNENGIDPGAFDSKGDDLINGPDVSAEIRELLHDPLASMSDDILGGGGGNDLDPLALFGGSDDGDLSDILSIGKSPKPSASASGNSGRISDTYGAGIDDLLRFPAPEASHAAAPVVPPPVRQTSAAAHATEKELDEFDRILGGHDDAPVSPIVAAPAAQPAQPPAAVERGPDTALPPELKPEPEQNYAAQTPAPVVKAEAPAVVAPVVAPPVVEAPVAAQISAPVSSPSPSAPVHPKTIVQQKKPPAAPVADHAETASSLDAEELYQAFIEGLEIEGLQGRGALDKNFVKLVGRLLRNYVQGTVELMVGRAFIKNESRTPVTLIAPDDNNPLKFSPNADVALLHLLGRRLPGFMEPVEAVQEAFTDLHAHQIGLVSGMQSALNHVLDRFNPSVIGDDEPSRGLFGGVLSVWRKAQLWDAYGRLFEKTRESTKEHFFGAAFLKAYEQAIAEMQSGGGDKP
jgi:type VI secretion system FHA domain protein